MFERADNLLRVTGLTLLWAALLLSFAWAATPCLAQPQEGETLSDWRWREGYNGFAMICRALELEPEDDEDRFWRHPASESVLVIFGRPHSTRALSAFIERGGAVLMATDRRFSRRVFPFSFEEGPLLVNEVNGFMQSRDCPIVSELSQRHPVTKGVQQIATNKPGYVEFFPSRFESLGSFTGVNRFSRQPSLIAASQKGPPQLMLGDPSIFTNQMLFHLDNSKFAIQAMQWLKGEDRKHLMILNRGRLDVPSDPRFVDAELPPLTKDMVLQALKNLPPDGIASFGNELASIVQEEDLVNELLTTSIDKVSDVKYLRALIFLATAMLVAFLFYRSITSEGTLQPALGTDVLDGKTDQSGKMERRIVARELLARFYGQTTGGQFDIEMFPSGMMLLVDASTAKPIWKSMERVRKNVHRKSGSWWTERRLSKLQAELNAWEQMRQAGTLVADPNFGAGNSPQQSNELPPVIVQKEDTA